LGGDLVTIDVINDMCYCFTVIKSFRSKETEELFRLGHVRRWAAIERQALRKLLQLELAQNLNDMRVPPGNRLESLTGDRSGQHSIRINDQFRVCFRWVGNGAEDVEIVDYH
jgi:toxin HigB-1